MEIGVNGAQKQWGVVKNCLVEIGAFSAHALLLCLSHTKPILMTVLPALDDHRLTGGESDAEGKPAFY